MTRHDDGTIATTVSGSYRRCRDQVETVMRLAATRDRAGRSFRVSVSVEWSDAVEDEQRPRERSRRPR